MKLIQFGSLLTLTLLVAVATPGCRKRPGDVRAIHGTPTENPQDFAYGPGTNPTNADNLTSQAFPLTDPTNHMNWARDEEIFKSDTVYFAFDSSVLKADQKTKVGDVAKYLTQNQPKAVEVQGHCDERGTAEYNRALGERRALAVREELIRLGIDPSRIDTLSYGFDRPVDPAHNDAAWSKNRRGEFILLTPPKKTVE